MTVRDFLIKFQEYQLEHEVLNANFAHNTVANKFMKRHAVKNCVMPDVSISLQRRQLAEKILLALLQNPERYKYISEQVESGKLKQEEANIKNINKAYKIAESFLSVSNNENYE